MDEYNLSLRFTAFTLSPLMLQPGRSHIALIFTSMALLCFSSDEACYTIACVGLIITWSFVIISIFRLQRHDNYEKNSPEKRVFNNRWNGYIYGPIYYQ